MKSLIIQSLKALRVNKARTLLTMLGIVIGVGTIILVLSAGAGFKSYLNHQIEQFGSNTVTIETVVPPTTKQREGNGMSKDGDSAAAQAIAVETFKNRDIELIKKIPNVKNAYGAVINQDVVAYKGKTKNTFLFGSGASRFDIDKGAFALGRPFTESEERGLAQVAILGSDIKEYFFGDTDPIGELVRIGELNFKVIGVYEPRGSLGFSNDDEQIFIPLSTLQKKVLGIDYLFYGIVELVDETKAEFTADDIRATLRKSHQISKNGYDDFRVATQKQNLGTFETILTATTFLLLAVAAISLVVGGVGVMNIMYVVVTERTGEVGLKKALGATNKNIQDEFLTEAIMVTLLGGVGGIILGSILSYLVSVGANAVGFYWEFSVPLVGIALGVGVSMLIGVIFGVFPARQAAKLDPIEALRRE